MLRVGLALLFGMLVASVAQAQSMAEAAAQLAAQLAARISSLPQRRANISLEFENLTAAAPAELSNFRTALQEELRKVGVETTAGPSETRLRITVSENVRGLLFVAVVTSGENRQVVMLPWNAPPATAIRPRVKISLQPMVEQPEAVLDMLLVNSGSELLILSPSKVSSYKLAAAKWTPEGVGGVSWARPLPRDQRGRLENGPAGFRIFVPGTSCNGTLQPEFRVTCAAGNDTWPLNPRDPSLEVRWVTDRNWLESDDARGAFYSAGAGWFANAEDRIVDRLGQALAGAGGWGSELSGIENPCGTGWIVLGSAAGEVQVRDQLQAYEIVDGQAVAASEAMALPGAVTALWPAETPGQSTLVIRNSKTGNYEASRLGVACAE